MFNKHLETQSKGFQFSKPISLLKFQYRVLKEAENLTHPLLERLQFLFIFLNNMNEFFQVRVPEFWPVEQLRHNDPVYQSSIDLSCKLFEHQYELFQKVLYPALETKNIFIIQPYALSPQVING